MNRLLTTFLLALLTIAAGAQPTIDNAEWITTAATDITEGQSLPMFRKTFRLQQQPRQAVLLATALGIYDVSLNGQPVGRHELKPGWTDYRKEVTFQTMDVAPLLRKGDNDLCVQLSRGWWAGAISRGEYGRQPQLMDSISMALGKAADAQHYRQLYQDIRQEFCQRYLTADGRLKETTQTAYLLALRFGLLPEEHRAAARDSLRQKIEQNGYRLSTGFVGTALLCPVLSDLGMDDLAYALLLQRQNPSWLYSVDQGATTIWERWDSYTREGGFHKHHWNMNSFNHYAYGVIAEWMYAYVGGIRPGAPGFSHVILAPHADRRPDGHPTLQSQPRIGWARTRILTPHGYVTSEWHRLPNGHYRYEFSLPQSVTFDVQIPNPSADDEVIVKRESSDAPVQVAL